MNALLPALIVGFLTLFAADWIRSNLAPKDATESESDVYRYGGAAIGAWVAMTYAVKAVKKG